MAAVLVWLSIAGILLFLALTIRFFTKADLRKAVKYAEGIIYFTLVVFFSYVFIRLSLQ